MKKRTEKLPIQTRKLNVIPESINEADRTVDVVFTTGAAVKRYLWSGESYNEKLEVSNKAINFERLNAGAAILDSHNSFGVNSLLGAVVPDSARIDNGKGIITARFLKDDEAADKVWNKIRQGFLRFFSVGYSVEKYIETLVGGVRTLTAVSWTPLEVSIVTVPADAGAMIRANSDYSECEITYMEERKMGKKEKREEEEKKKIEGEEEEKEEREEEEEKEDSESEEEEKKEEEKEDKKESKAKVSDKRGITKAEEIREAMELCILADYSLIQARSLINSSKSIIELRSKIINAKANSFEEKATLPTQSLKTESCRSLSTIAKNIYQI